MLPAILGLSDWQFDVALALVWLLILATTLYRDYLGLRSRHDTYLWTAVSLFWFGYSVFTLANYPIGVFQTALHAVGAVTFLLALAASVQWWRTRGTTAQN